MRAFCAIVNQNFFTLFHIVFYIIMKEKLNMIQRYRELYASTIESALPFFSQLYHYDHMK